jgi:sugar phosphate isomerase/epimerase
MSGTIKNAVTISLVQQAKGGPFVFWDDLPGSIRAAGELGFDAVEIFAPGPEAIDAKALGTMLDDAGLKLAAVGTGAGWVIHKLLLTDVDASQRAKAKDFVRSIVDLGGPFGAPAIIGSMQGRWHDALPRDRALGLLGEALVELGEHAAQFQTPLLYEPLNRYETNLINRLDDGVALLSSLGGENIKLLADLFHMNIEEQNIADALRSAGKHVGHVHFVDSNRRPAGNGHLDFAPIAAALRDIGYAGYCSAEAFSWPDAHTAARTTIDTFRKHFR